MYNARERSLTPVLIGDTEGQPVACYDATSVVHSATQIRDVPLLMPETLEAIRYDYFVARSALAGSIVAVLVAPVSSDTDYGLVFVAAGGPLGGCGEASMLAAMLVLEARPTVTFETAAGVIAARPSGEREITLTMPRGTAHIDVAEVDYECKPLRIRTLSAGGNVFAAVPAAALDLEVSAQGAPDLTERGASLLAALSASAPDSGAPDMLLVTTPVRSGRTSSAVIWGDEILNMGPCGTGTCARYVLAVADGDVARGSVLSHESPFGNVFKATSVGDEPIGGSDMSIQVEISGRVTVSA